MTETDELLAFIAEAHKNTYAAPKEIREKSRCTRAILPGHKDFKYEKGDWSYYDSYAGIFKAPGREVVFFKEVPMWSMSYGGALLPAFQTEASEIYGFLKEALNQFDAQSPFRGPSEWARDALLYKFNFEGDVAGFHGRESISISGEEVFFQHVFGSTIE